MHSVCRHVGRVAPRNQLPITGQCAFPGLTSFESSTGDFASTELMVDCFQAADHPYPSFCQESRSFIRRIVVMCELACFP